MTKVTFTIQGRPWLQSYPHFKKQYCVYDQSHVLVLKSSMTTVMSLF